MSLVEEDLSLEDTIEVERKRIRKKKIINSKEYDVLSFIARGSWGAVYRVLHKGMEWAVKVYEPSSTALEQMEIRENDLAEMIQKEGLLLQGCDDVVQRYPGKDDDGKEFIVMHLYEQFLDDKLREGTDDRVRLGHGLSFSELMEYSLSIARGLGQIHGKLGRAQADLNPNNIAIDGKRTKIEDIGTSTHVSISKAGPNRFNMGFKYTRAPEAHLEHPLIQSDIWSFGSLMYRMITGKYIFEDEIDKDINYIRDLSVEKGNFLVKNKLKKVSRRYRGLLERCLQFDPNERYRNGDQLVDGLNYLYTSFKSTMTTATPWIIGAVGMVGIFSYAIYRGEIDKPTDLFLPELSQRNWYGVDTDEQRREKGLQFVVDDGTRIAYDYPNINVGPIIQSTNNLPVAVLIKAYEQAKSRVSVQSQNYYDASFSESQNRFFNDYGPKPAVPNGRSIPVRDPYLELKFLLGYAMHESILFDGSLDLEDVCARTMLGDTKVESAKMWAKSYHWKDYQFAKTDLGDLVIPESRRNFINELIRYAASSIETKTIYPSQHRGR